ncbi:MAG: CYTH domain-containing protein [bacterium]
MSKQNVEKEVKILNIDSSYVNNRLVELGAKKVLDAVTYIITFDVVNTIIFKKIPKKYREIIKQAKNLTKNGKSLKEQNIHLRVRKQVDQYELTLKYKAKKEENSKVKNEVENNIHLTKDEWALIEKTFLLAGLTVIARQEKQRTSYILNQIKFDIDTWPTMPSYVEIEASTEKEIEDGIRILKIKNPVLSNLSGQKLFSKYGINFYSDLIFNRPKY